MHTPKHQSETGRMKVLIVGNKQSALLRHLTSIFKSYDTDVYLSPVISKNAAAFTQRWIIEPSSDMLPDLTELSAGHTAIVFHELNVSAEKTLRYLQKNAMKRTKILILNKKLPTAYTIEQMIWFLHDPGNEWVYFAHSADPNPDIAPTGKTKGQKRTIKKRWFVLGAIIALIVFHLSFLVPLSAASYHLYHAFSALERGDRTQSHSESTRADYYLQIARSFYQPARPLIHLFSLGKTPETIFQLNQTGTAVISDALSLSDAAEEFATLLFSPSADPITKEKIIRAHTALTRSTYSLVSDLGFFVSIIPPWNTQLKDAKKELGSMTETLKTARAFLPHLPTILAVDGKKQYLLLFANNMELRPGGGFIGSFGILRTEQFTAPALTIYDVYDADGQLSAHIPPPEPIRTILNQPHWFLRDSAFSPDNQENYLTATKFLEKEMGFRNFDGGILITTSALQTILRSVGEMYVPEFREKITHDNFYLKAQLYAEKDFFPGSIQKKSFLSAVADSLITTIETKPSLTIASALIEALDRKQIALAFADPDLQETADTLHWSGRLITPQCTGSPLPCLSDYLFPYDANLGVNKANIFIRKSASLDITISDTGAVSHELHMAYRNDSPNDVFPGGKYKNYLQILLPADSQVTAVQLNNEPIKNYDEDVSDYRRIGFLAEVAPDQIADVVITYDLTTPLPDSTARYQLVIQKQIGSPDYDFRVRLYLPPTLHSLSQNVSALVKDGAIIYNTSINTDKIFLFELSRK